ncbi:ubiquinol-cytochrome C chaperone family protein [Magnetofaba australis]|uniref:Ubiquinol-cytochrome c chaperone domain-containing protein n=1 Tax=Magnetofaba australis IT-1 TaxID=1434232 RepID=A0A1Y2K5V6_9PROT|nr:ubiquinol-cytochrome C chaperone family protein [Magnetofaba australis]OSM05074.1 hypothetical protein MAIT1_03212 [Magnetofaba australis IT-1]
MSWLQRLFGGSNAEQRLKRGALAAQKSLASAALKLSENNALGVEDDFDHRFETMILVGSALSFHVRRQAGNDAARINQALWDAIFEGFDYSMRQRGVNDIRIGARMEKLLQNAMGRRDVYLNALENDDEPALRAAIRRNVLDSNCETDDPRIDGLIDAMQKMRDYAPNLIKAS